MNTPTTNLLDLIRDDAHAAGFQSLGQYRKALVEAATAAATITIGETHSPVKVRLGLRLIGDEEVATITLTQHDQTVILHCADQAHAARIAAAIEALPAAPAVQGEPVAWQLRTPEGRVILNKEFPAWADGGDGYKITPLYTAPQPAEQKPCPEDIREGAPYDDPAFESLCREHDIWGTAAAAQCAVFWEAGKRVAEQQPAPDVAGLVDALEAIQKAATHESIHTGIQAGTALGCIAAICDVALAAHRRQGGEE